MAKRKESKPLEIGPIFTGDVKSVLEIESRGAEQVTIDQSRFLERLWRIIGKHRGVTLTDEQVKEIWSDGLLPDTEKAGRGFAYPELSDEETEKIASTRREGTWTKERLAKNLSKLVANELAKKLPPSEGPYDERHIQSVVQHFERRIWTRITRGLREKFDSSSSSVASSLTMPTKDGSNRGEGKPGHDIDGLLQHAAIHGQETLTADEWRAIAKHASQAAKELAKSEAIATVQRLAHELFPELKADQRATANRLTKLFAKHGSDVVDDETKLQFVELTRAWKAAGGSLEYDGQAVRLDTVSNGEGNQRSFQVLESRKGSHPVKTTVHTPELTFVG